MATPVFFNFIDSCSNPLTGSKITLRTYIPPALSGSDANSGSIKAAWGGPTTQYTDNTGYVLFNNIVPSVYKVSFTGPNANSQSIYQSYDPEYFYINVLESSGSLVDGFSLIITQLPQSVQITSASYSSFALSSSYSQTSSFSLNSPSSISSSYALTASYLSGTASYSSTASFALNSPPSISSSYAATASVLNSPVISSSYSLTASFALNGSSGGSNITSGSTYNITASNAISSSNSIISNFSISSSWASSSLTTSFLNGTASWSNNSLSSNVATSASWSSASLSASFVNGNMTGSLFGTASYSITASSTISSSYSQVTSNAIYSTQSFTSNYIQAPTTQSKFVPPITQSLIADWNCNFGLTTLFVSGTYVVSQWQDQHINYNNDGSGSHIAYNTSSTSDLWTARRPFVDPKDNAVIFPYNYPTEFNAYLAISSSLKIGSTQNYTIYIVGTGMSVWDQSFTTTTQVTFGGTDGSNNIAVGAGFVQAGTYSDYWIGFNQLRSIAIKAPMSKVIIARAGTSGNALCLVNNGPFDGGFGAGPTLATNMAGGYIGLFASGSIQSQPYFGKIYRILIYNQSHNEQQMRATHEALAQQHNINLYPNKQIIFTGDSITAGTSDYSSSGANYGIPSYLHSYPSQWSDANPDWIMWNYGWYGAQLGASGSTGTISEAALTLIDPKITSSYSQNIVSVMAGTNDIASGGQSGSQVISRLVSFLSQRRAAGFKTATWTIPAYTSFTGSNQIYGSTGYNTLIRNSMTSSLTDILVDAGAASLTESRFNTSSNKNFINDGIHPTELGYEILSYYAKNYINTNTIQLQPIYASASFLNGNATASIFGTSSFSVSSSYTQTASFALTSAAGGGTTLITASTYQITSSWANNSLNTVSASWASSSITSAYSPNFLVLGQISSQGVGANSEQYGAGALAVATEGTVLGFSSSVTNQRGTAIGAQAVATNNFDTALGYIASAGGGNSVALGVQATTTGIFSVALGSVSNDNGFDHCVAVGNHATNSAAHQIMLGTTSETTVVPGILNASNTTASVFGTSSWAVNAVSASFTSTSSFTIITSGSFASSSNFNISSSWTSASKVSISSSFASQSISASFANVIPYYSSAQSIGGTTSWSFPTGLAVLHAYNVWMTFSGGGPFGGPTDVAITSFTYDVSGVGSGPYLPLFTVSDNGSATITIDAIADPANSGISAPNNTYIVAPGGGNITNLNGSSFSNIKILAW